VQGVQGVLARSPGGDDEDFESFDTGKGVSAAGRSRGYPTSEDLSLT